MDDEYKPNLYKSRQQDPLFEKKVKPAIAGKAKTKKKNEIQKLTDIFISEDIENVKDYIFMSVLVPAVKKAISDIVTKGVDMILYGESSQNKTSPLPASKVSYWSHYGGENARRDRSNAALRGLEYDDILFATRNDAEAVLNAMDDIIAQYRMVSVGDLYDLANIDNDNFTLDKYGWYDVRGCKAVAVRDGYVLRLPRPVPLN